MKKGKKNQSKKSFKFLKVRFGALKKKKNNIKNSPGSARNIKLLNQIINLHSTTPLITLEIRTHQNKPVHSFNPLDTVLLFIEPFQSFILRKDLKESTTGKEYREEKAIFNYLTSALELAKKQQEIVAEYVENYRSKTIYFQYSGLYCRKKEAYEVDACMTRIQYFFNDKYFKCLQTFRDNVKNSGNKLKISELKNCFDKLKLMIRPHNYAGYNGTIPYPPPSESLLIRDEIALYSSMEIKPSYDLPPLLGETCYYLQALENGYIPMRALEYTLELGTAVDTHKLHALSARNREKNIERREETTFFIRNPQEKFKDSYYYPKDIQIEEINSICKPSPVETQRQNKTFNLIQQQEYLSERFLSTNIIRPKFIRIELYNRLIIMINQTTFPTFYNKLGNPLQSLYLFAKPAQVLLLKDNNEHIRALTLYLSRLLKVATSMVSKLKEYQKIQSEDCHAEIIYFFNARALKAYRELLKTCSAEPIMELQKSFHIHQNEEKSAQYYADQIKENKIPLRAMPGMLEVEQSEYRLSRLEHSQQSVRLNDKLIEEKAKFKKARASVKPKGKNAETLKSEAIDKFLLKNLSIMGSYNALLELYINTQRVSLRLDSHPEKLLVSLNPLETMLRFITPFKSYVIESTSKQKTKYKSALKNYIANLYAITKYQIDKIYYNQAWQSDTALFTIQYEVNDLYFSTLTRFRDAAKELGLSKTSPLLKCFEQIKKNFIFHHEADQSGNLPLGIGGYYLDKLNNRHRKKFIPMRARPGCGLEKGEKYTGSAARVLCSRNRKIPNTTQQDELTYFARKAVPLNYEMQLSNKSISEWTPFQRKNDIIKSSSANEVITLEHKKNDPEPTLLYVELYNKIITPNAHCNHLLFSSLRKMALPLRDLTLKLAKKESGISKHSHRRRFEIALTTYYSNLLDYAKCLETTLAKFKHLKSPALNTEIIYFYNKQYFRALLDFYISVYDINTQPLEDMMQQQLYIHTHLWPKPSGIKNKKLLYTYTRTLKSEEAFATYSEITKSHIPIRAKDGCLRLFNRVENQGKRIAKVKRLPHKNKLHPEQPKNRLTHYIDLSNQCFKFSQEGIRFNQALIKHHNNTTLSVTAIERSTSLQN